ncbi:hypothetical protein C8F04DRAFT_1403174 [Mycena alexandri]|uniref:Uncharacterized protein n=1 Tax=Mycena alexandri TaxID=1745969 RepID=A0AAD6S4T0_9AGAR|nr:hypothetical protein C8F04DRAFT_1403174 [Mycena alexandri]
MGHIQPVAKGSHLPLHIDDALFTQNLTSPSVPPLAAPGCFIIADNAPASTVTDEVAPTGTLRAAAEALVQATAVPDDLKAATNKVVGHNSKSNTNAALEGLGSGGFILTVAAVVLVLAGL